VIEPKIPTVTELKPWLNALKKSPPGGCLIIAIDLPANQNFPIVAWAVFSKTKRTALRRAILSANRKRQKAGKSLTTEIPLS
jgi:hypothetical protein